MGKTFKNVDKYTGYKVGDKSRKKETPIEQYRKKKQQLVYNENY